jgi:phosphate transport system permease protein
MATLNPPAHPSGLVHLLQLDARTRSRRAFSALMNGIVTACAFSGVVILGIILGYIVIRGAPALNLSFFTERPLPYGEVGGGVAPAIMGTLEMVAVAALIAVPLGIGTAIYLTEFGRGHFAEGVRFSLDLLAGLPSIVVGVFVWAFLVRQVIGNYAGIAGGIALSIIAIPIVARTVEEMLRLVPNTLREASYALGVPVWKTVLMVVLPSAKSGIVTSVVLALARAAGETAPLLLTALGNQFFNVDLRQPMAALPLQIYNYAVSPYEDWHTKAWGSSLVLILVIGGVSLLARFSVRGSRLSR